MASMTLKPARVSGRIAASAPPAIMTSAAPRRMSFRRLADRISAGGAGGDHGHVGPAGAEDDGDLAAGRIGEHHRH
jgi:hypothetical protein